MQSAAHLMFFASDWHMADGFTSLMASIPVML
jgi:hypothetical protein